MTALTAGTAPGVARGLFPGLLACGVVAAASTFLSEHYGAPVMLFALLPILEIIGAVLLLRGNDTGRIFTIVFSVLLLVTFAAWYAQEGTLSVRSITTRRRETYYWLAILFTFALGTAAGDLVAERWQVGYLLSAAMFGALIAVAALAHLRFKLNAIFAFWFAYIMTRPLGASIGDYLSQPRSEGGLGLGTVGTSALFLTAILGLVIYLTVTRKDVITSESVAT